MTLTKITGPETFYLSALPVTRKEYEAIRAFAAQHGFDLSAGLNAGDCPVGNLSWYDAVKTCNALSLMAGRRPVYQTHDGFMYRSGTSDEIKIDKTADGYRLPTASEWEYACRAGTNSRYFWGDEADNRYAWGVQSPPNRLAWTPQPAGKVLPNPFGLYDMSGNVNEWCFDWYDNLPFQNTWRVMRGGSMSLDDIIDSGFYHFSVPYYQCMDTGMRIAADCPLPDLSELLQSDKTVLEPPMPYPAKSLQQSADELAEFLDFSTPELQKTICLYQQGDYEGFLKSWASSLLNRQLDLSFERDYLSFDGACNFDALYNVEKPAWFHPNDPAWTAVTFDRLKPLIYRWQETGEERFIEKWCWYIQDYMKNYLYEYNSLTYEERKADCWPPLPWAYCDGFNTSWRVISILSILWKLGNSKRPACVTDQFLADLTVYIVKREVPICIKDSRLCVPNQLAHNAQMFAMLTESFFMFRDAPTWSVLAETRFRESVMGTFLKDGSDLEQSLNYNGGFVDKCAQLKKMYLKKEPPAWIQEMDAYAQLRRSFLLSLTQPFGGLPTTGTAGLVCPPNPASEIYMESIQKRLGEAPEITWWEQAKKHLLANTDAPVEFTSVSFPYGGYYVSRSGWGPQDIYLFFQTSRHGRGHATEACNGIQLCGYGRQFLVGAGASSYGNKGFVPEDQWEIIEQIDHYQHLSFGRNTVLVDGMSQKRLYQGENSFYPEYSEPIPCLNYISDHFDVFEGRYEDGYGMSYPETFPTHTRRVIFVKRAELFIIIDNMNSDEPHRYTQTWGFMPEGVDMKTYQAFGFRQNEVVTGQNCIFTKDPDGANIFLNQFGQRMDYQIHYGELNPAYGWLAPAIGARRVSKPDVHAMWQGDIGNSTLLTVISFSRSRYPQVRFSDLSDERTKRFHAEGQNFTLDCTVDQQVTIHQLCNGQQSSLQITESQIFES